MMMNKLAVVKHGHPVHCTSSYTQQGSLVSLLTCLDIELIEEIFTKADAKKRPLETTPSLKPIMDTYKAILKKHGLDPSKDTKLYKLLLKLCMNKKISWKCALEAKKKSQAKRHNAALHFQRTLLYRHFYYWIYTVHQHKTLRIAPDVNKTFKAQSKENMKILQNPKLKSPLNRSFVLNRGQNKTCTGTRETAHKKYQYFMMQEVKLKKMKAKRHQVLLTKGLRGFMNYVLNKQAKREEKNRLIETCIMALEYHEHREMLKAFLALKKHCELSKTAKYANIVLGQKRATFLVTEAFIFWVKRFSKFKGTY